MIEHVDESRMKYICDKIMQNRAIQISNSTIWTGFLDEQLKDFVIFYNFNFFEVANRFHEFIAFPFKYDFSENEIRRHWSFLHAARYLNLEIDGEYYDKLKARAVAETDKENHLFVDENYDPDKDKREMEKYKAERFNLIDVPPVGQENIVNNSVKAINENKSTNPEDDHLNNDELFEKAMEKIDLKNIDDVKNIHRESVIVTHEKNDKQNKNLNKIENKKNLEDEIVETTINSFKELKNISDTTNGKNNFSDLALNKKENIEKNNSVGKLNNFEDDDIINALFNISENMNREENKDLNLVEDGKDYKIEQKEINEDELFPINTRNLPEHNLSQEEIIKYRENLLKGYNKDGIDKEIEKTKSINDLIQEDEGLKTQYDNLNTYFKFAVKSLNYFIPKMGKNLETKDKNLENSENTNQENKGIFSLIFRH